MLAAVPCFSGAEWDLGALKSLSDLDVRLLRLPEGEADLDDAADAVLAAVEGAERFVVAGDSYGAAVALTLALRRPAGLAGLVLSGGFARDPNPRWKTVVGAQAPRVPGLLYREILLRFHATQLSSRFDARGEVRLGASDFRRLFVDNTPSASYGARVRSVQRFDVVARLPEVQVPALVITPEEDRLIGAAATRTMVAGLSGATEVVLPGTGHMFRFTHPGLYSATVASFVREITLLDQRR